MPDDTDPTRIEPQPTEAHDAYGAETVIDADLFATAARAGQSTGDAMEKPGDFIGRYRLVEKLGEGGFGAVWRAEQSEPIHREVALKVIKAGMDSAEIIARFEAERQALALMDHPNIAGVLDAGATESRRPYFVMELVKAVPITEFADAQKLTIRERLELFIPVCQAVQHAHQKAILHRDLKPSNILIAEVDGRPVPKVIDFGIAKALGASPEDALRASRQLTQTGAFIGTPRYMSPEQAGANRDLDTRSDIYTLGVILFELLTGDTPLSEQTLRGAALDEMLRMIRESEPPRPSGRVMPANELARKTATTRGTEPQKLTRTLRGDLDWITLKALEKDRERRYGSAAALAADIARHLHSEPVEAGPPSALYRFRKLVRRNSLTFAASAIIFLLLVAGITVSTWQMFRARRAESRSRAEKMRADEESATALAVSDFLRNDLLRQAGSRKQVAMGAKPNPNLTVREALDRASKEIGNRFRDEPHVEAAIRDTIGFTYNDLGDGKSAAPHFLRAIQIATELVGADHPVTLQSRHNLARALYSQGKHAEAEMEYRSVLAIQERVKGPEHRDTLTTRNNLALAVCDQGKFAEAEREHRAMLAIRERVLGQEHPDTLQSRHNLAFAQGAQGKHAEAEREYRNVLAILERVKGEEHPDTLMTQMGVAHSLNSQAKYADAEAEYRALQAVMTRVLGAEHPDTLRARSGVALALKFQGKRAEAEQEYRAVMMIDERTLGPEHPNTLMGRDSLAALLEARGKHSEAEKEHRAVLAIMERVLGAENPETLVTRNFLATALVSQSKHAEAEMEYRTALAIQERTLGVEHPGTLDTRNNLAIALRAQDKHVEAEKENRLALAISERVRGADHPGTLSIRMGLANTLSYLGRHAEAEKEHRAVLAASERVLGEEHPATLGSRSNLAAVLQSQGRLPEAEQELRATFTIMERVLGAEHPNTLKCRSNLAVVLGRQKKHAVAEQELRAVLAARERMLGAEHGDVFESCYNLGLCLADQKKLKEALEFMRRAEAGREKVLGKEHQDSKSAKAMRERIEGNFASTPIPAPAPDPKSTPTSPSAPHASLITSDGFEYAERQPIRGLNGGDGWAGAWTGTLATADGVSLVTDEFPARGVSLLIPATEQEVILSRLLGPLEKFAAPAQGGTWFFACLLQHGSDLPVPGGDIQINPFNATNVHDLVRIVASDVGGALQVTLNNEPNPIEVKDASKPFLVVLRIALKNPKAGKWDLDAELSVNPPLTDTEPPLGARKVTVTLKDVRLPQQLGLLIRKPARSEATTRVDEIRYTQRFTDLAFRPPAAAPLRK